MPGLVAQLAGEKIDFCNADLQVNAIALAELNSGD